MLTTTVIIKTSPAYTTTTTTNNFLQLQRSSKINSKCCSLCLDKPASTAMMTTDATALLPANCTLDNASVITIPTTTTAYANSNCYHEDQDRGQWEKRLSTTSI